jgi:uncharacterized protein (DUF58 family)
MKTLKTVLLKTKKRIFSELSGNNISRLKGEGSDFEEIRAYIHGDDRRKIDWKNSAKMQSLYVRVYNETREINVVIASLLNGNLEFGTQKKKKDLLIEICAILGYSTIKNGDIFRGATLSIDKKQINSSSKKIFLLEEYLNILSSQNLLNLKSDFTNDINYLKKYIKKKSLLFIISDFLDEIDLSTLSKKHEIVVIVVRDKFEESPILEGEINLIDPESGEEIETYLTKNMLKQYKREYIKNDNKLFTHLNHLGISYTKIYTNEDPFTKLMKI